MFKNIFSIKLILFLSSTSLGCMVHTIDAMQACMAKRLQQMSLLAAEVQISLLSTSKRFVAHDNQREILNCSDLVNQADAVKIRSIKAQDIVVACMIFYKAVFELQIVPSTRIEELMEQGYLDDIQDMATIDATYNNNRGRFLVVEDNGVVVGMGGIKKLDNLRCEVTHLFFDSAYRKQGLGSLLLKELLDFAISSGYIKAQLTVWNPERQINSIKFYKKFSFYEIEPYKFSGGKMFLEKIL